MKRLRFGGRLVVAVAVGGVLFGIATAVQASIPDANGVIHACFNTSVSHGNPTGVLRVIDTSKQGGCAAWEQPLNWSSKGPTGARGATGPVGPTGATGPIGPSNAYSDYTAVQNVPINGAAVLASVVVPAGRYTLSGTATSESTDANPIFTSCEFDSTAAVNQAGASGSGLLVTMPLIGDVDVTSNGTTVSLRCALPLSGPARMSGGMIATRLGTITPAS